MFFSVIEYNVKSTLLKIDVHNNTTRYVICDTLYVTVAHLAKCNSGVSYFNTPRCAD